MLHRHHTVTVCFGECLSNISTVYAVRGEVILFLILILSFQMPDRQEVDRRVTMLPSVVIIKEEEDVLYILQEQLPELFRLNLAGAGADWTRGVIDYLVSRTVNPDSRKALLILS